MVPWLNTEEKRRVEGLCETVMENFLLLMSCVFILVQCLKQSFGGIYYGLKTTRSPGFCRIKVVSNLLSDINLVKDGCPPTHPHPLHMLVENIHQIHRNSGLVV